MIFRSFESDVRMSPAMLVKFADFALQMGDQAAAADFIADAYAELDDLQKRKITQIQSAYLVTGSVPSVRESVGYKDMRVSRSCG